MGGYVENLSDLREIIEVTLERNLAPFADQSVTVVGFIGGVAFATLVFVLQAWKEFLKPVVLFSTQVLTGRTYFDPLVTLLGATSALAITGSVVLAGIAANDPDLTRGGKLFGIVSVALSMLGITVSIPMCILAFSHVAALATGIIAVILLYFQSESSRTPARPPRSGATQQSPQEPSTPTTQCNQTETEIFNRAYPVRKPYVITASR